MRSYKERNTDKVAEEEEEAEEEAEAKGKRRIITNSRSPKTRVPPYTFGTESQLRRQT